MKTIARVLALVSLGLSSLLYLRVHTPAASKWTGAKLFAELTAPYLVIVGVLGGLLGLVRRSPMALLAGTVGAVLAAAHFQRVTAPHSGLEKAFGPEWEGKLGGEQKRRMLERRWVWRFPKTPTPRRSRDVVFWTIPGTGRELLCDIWQPPAGVAPSGLAVLYFHGSGWHWMDKDFGTRPLFRHLTAQGHVVMDVAYRLCPETDVRGMLGDVKRAIAWMKENGERYGVRRDGVVVSGSSAGGHLALLAAYTPGHKALTPDELMGVDCSARGVVSYYGPVDMRAYYGHAGQTLGFQDVYEQENDSPVAKAMDFVIRSMGVEFEPLAHKQMMANLLGGQPEEVPEAYDLASPIAHVGPWCPPTLMFQGEYDSLVPAEAARELHHKLVENGVPAVYVEFPKVDHAWDVGLGPLMQGSPPAKAALYDFDRFLALVREVELPSSATA